MVSEEAPTDVSGANAANAATPIAPLANLPKVPLLNRYFTFLLGGSAVIILPFSVLPQAPRSFIDSVSPMLFMAW